MRPVTWILAIGAILLIAVPAGAEPDRSIRTRTFEHIGPKHCKRYDALHDWATKQFGKKTVGRDICRYGMPKRKGDGARLPTKAEYTDTMGVLNRWRHPPAPTPVQTSTGSQPQAGVSYGGGGGGGGCVGMSAESGSAGYNAYNPNGGYIGCYQIAPGHYAAGGSCAGLGTDPAGQDACAQRICATEGPGAWTNPAGQNPCGRP